ncbi:MAG: hypothetical protein EXS09_13650 [Gemmataceae bacterium]|nr:hypothetical protein [Gemmataceae bacterium]
MFWIREIAGWAFIVLGLWLFYVSYFVLLRNGYIIQSGPTVLMGIVVFRGGIHLLKVAVAARVCQRAPAESGLKATRKEVARPDRPASVVPGRRATSAPRA